MSGFDNGTTQGGVFFQVKEAGPIVRGFGPPVPQMGVMGDVYIDVQTWQLFNKRATDSVDPWGHYLFVVPAEFRTSLKWFSSAAPANSLGTVGDYCMLWGGFANYGMRPSFYGPKQATGWPENGNGPNMPIAPPGDEVLQLGIDDEGPTLPESTSTQLVVLGLVDEFIWPVPVLDAAGDPVQGLGVQSGPQQTDTTLNPLYTAVDQHTVT